MFCTESEFLKTIDKCKKGVAWKSSTQMYYIKRLTWAANTLLKIDSGIYSLKRQSEFTIHERGKERRIKASHISDRVVQKAFNEYVLKPALYPRLIYDNAASQPGKGTDFCLNRVKKHLWRYYKKHANRGHVLLIDFSNYFASIDKEILLKLLRPYLKPEELGFMQVLLKNETEGLGLGSEINQTCAIFYASFLDHYIKEDLHIKYYCRYMDDLILIHPDKIFLERCLNKIALYCESIGVKVNPKKCKLVNLKSDCFIYLKKKIRLTDSGKIVMRPLGKNIKARKRRLKRQRDLLSKGIITMDSVVQSYISWRGYITKYDIKREKLLEVDLLFASLFGKDKILLVLSKFTNSKYYIDRIVRNCEVK